MGNVPYYKDAGKVPTDPPVAFTQEVRFAVVMYGGVSLAIYMNGVAQELLRLVRATAPAGRNSAHVRIPNRKLSGTEGIYRKLGQMLRRSGEPVSLADVEYKNKTGRPEPVRTRFVVDVVSGTSAGGINGVFLAKALANDQNMDQLKDLWIREGDFARLMNDKPTLPVVGGRPQSLLDGKHMYRELLKALEGMEVTGAGGGKKGGKGRRSPYVEELDLFVTSTDISGLTLPLQLADGVIKERRHRNTFQFIYTTEYASGEDRNDFDGAHNPFLAFASRCTSSFPVAFEPMKLGDIDGIVPQVEPYRTKGSEELSDALSGSAMWHKFFPDYITSHRDGGRGAAARAAEAAGEFSQRAFGDGGYLDNKPFSYATDTLLRRRADLPVERKLLFVDPDPQNPEKQPDFERDVDVIRNTLSALSPTVSTETIREDIQRILERNRLMERISGVTSGIEADVSRWGGRPGGSSHTLSGMNWAQRGLTQLIREKGIAYGGYHRLKVSEATDDLTLIVVNAANFDKDSDEFIAVRDFIRAWRDISFGDGTPQPGRPTQLNFLLDFHLSYRLRRLNFVRARIDEFSRYDLARPGDGGASARRALKDELKKSRSTLTLPADDGAWRTFHEEFHKALQDMQKELSNVYRYMLKAQRLFRRVGDENPLHEVIGSINAAGLTRAMLSASLEEPNVERRVSAAREFFKKNPAVRKAFDAVARNLVEGMVALEENSTGRAKQKKVGGFKNATYYASAKCARILSPEWAAAASAPEARRAARAVLWRYYQRFEDYDMVAFPIMYQTGLGESANVDVVRVSPYDSKNLIDETKDGGRRKLGGTELGHFGAFFEKGWRKNDIMWGRLDASERIITTLLPAPRTKQERLERQHLIDEAHAAILAEEMLPDGEANLRELYVRALAGASAGLTKADAVKKVFAQLKGTQPGNVTLKRVLDSCVAPEELLDYFKKGYEVDRQLDPKSMVRLFARSTKVFGRMLESLAEKHGVENKRVAWVTRLGQVFWGLVEVAVPGSFWNLMARQFVFLLYLFEFLLIVGGTLFINDPMQQLGLKALAVTLTVNFVVILLGQFMQGRYKLLRVAVVIALLLLAIPIIASAILGFDELWSNEWVRRSVADLTWVRQVEESRLVVWFKKDRSEEARALMAFGVASAVAVSLGLLAMILRAVVQGLEGFFAWARRYFAEDVGPRRRRLRATLRYISRH